MTSSWLVFTRMSFLLTRWWVTLMLRSCSHCYLESLEVEGVDVHFAESFPHAMNTVWSVTSVVGLDKDSGDHVHVVSVRNISELLLDHTHGLSGVLSTVERLEV